MNNMIIADISQGNAYPTNYKLYKYDYGRILRIQGMDLPSAVEIHFSLSESDGDSKRRVGVNKDGAVDVVIPDSMLENDSHGRDYCVYVFVYITDETSGQTVRKITLLVYSRPEPEAFDTPEDAQLFREAIEAVNAAADRAEEAEKSSEAWAHGHEKYPGRDEDNAKYYADQAHDDATKTSQDREIVERTSGDVNNMAMRVNADKEESEQYKSQAAQYAASALTSENNAKSSENTAKEAMEKAQMVEGQAELFAVQSEKSARASEAAKGLVMQIGQEVSENKEYVDKKIDDFDILHQQAIEDIDNAGNGKIESINAAGQKAIENIGTGIDPTFTQEGKAADANETGKRLVAVESDLGNINIIDLDTGQKFHGTIKVSNGKPILEYDEVSTE